MRWSNVTIQDEDMMAQMLFEVVGAFAIGFSGVAASFNVGRKLVII